MFLDKTINHLDKAANKFSSKIDDTDYAKELEKYNDRIAGFDEDIRDWEVERKTLESEISEGSSTLNSTRKKIEEALKLGDKAKLVAEINKCRKDIERGTQGSKKALEDISTLLNSDHLSAALISKSATKGLELLNGMSKKKQPPKSKYPYT